MASPIRNADVNFTLTATGTITTPSHKALAKAITAAKANPCYWIYVFTHGSEILYVGESTNGLHRLNSGFKRPKKHNLYYPWRTHATLARKTIVAVSFKLDAAFYNERANRRTLESELIYSIRKHSKTDRWPVFQGGFEVSETLRQKPQITNDLALILEELSASRIIPW
jgi:hypothetical protein